MILDQPTLDFVADNMMARVQMELIMRDNARRAAETDVADMHGDRAQAFKEAADAIRIMVS